MSECAQVTTAVVLFLAFMFGTGCYGCRQNEETNRSAHRLEESRNVAISEQNRVKQEELRLEQFAIKAGLRKETIDGQTRWVK